MSFRKTSFGKPWRKQIRKREKEEVIAWVRNKVLTVWVKVF
jgi:hypothetical protein